MLELDSFFDLSLCSSCSSFIFLSPRTTQPFQTWDACQDAGSVDGTWARATEVHRGQVSFTVGVIPDRVSHQVKPPHAEQPQFF